MQGVNYALTGDFTLNILNLSNFTGNQHSLGLLELHLTKDGVTMNLGTGGANVSIDNLISAINGIQVLLKNSEMNRENQKLSSYYQDIYDSLSEEEQDIYFSNPKNEINNEEASIEYESNIPEIAENNPEIIDNSEKKEYDTWVIKLDEDGNAESISIGGEYRKVTIVDADGNERVVDLEKESISEALGDSVGMTKEEMNKFMMANGLGFNNDTRLWFDTNDPPVYSPITDPPITESANNNKTGNWFTDTVDDIKNFAGDVWEGAKEGTNKAFSWLDEKLNDLKNLFNPNTLDTGIPYNTFTITDRNGKDIKLYVVDEKNPAYAGLLSQHDDAFAYDPLMSKAGCNFMVTLAYPQLIIGENLTVEQYRELWDKSRENGIVNEYGAVTDMNKLLDMTLEKLERNDIGMIYDIPQPGAQSTLVGYNIEVPYGDYTHTVAGNTSIQIIWNHGETTGDVKYKREIYVYAK